MTFEQKTILIVDDSPSIRSQIVMIFEKHNIAVREAGSEFGMMNAIEQYGKCVDLIIMDLTLKAEHGFDLITNLKQSVKYCNIPILVLTEHADAMNVLSARQLGVDGYLRKPINVDNLLEKVNSLFLQI